MCVMDFLNFLFPVKCGICNKISKEAICNNCLNNLYKIEKVKIINVKNNYYNTMPNLGYVNTLNYTMYSDTVMNSYKYRHYLFGVQYDEYNKRKNYTLQI